MQKSKIMSTEQALIAEVRSLTPQQQQEVLNFAVFLRQRNPRTVESHTAQAPISKKSTPGLHADVPYWMAEDFDAPLPDAFWLGEE